MIKYAKKTNYPAKKVAAGHYLYRGWTIKRFDYGTLGDPECAFVEWNVFAPGEENWNDSVPTLSLAKSVVNGRLKQAEERAIAEAVKEKPLLHQCHVQTRRGGPNRVSKKRRRPICPIFG